MPIRTGTVPMQIPPSAASHIQVSGGGPTGLVLRGNRLYVFTRFDNAISVVDTATGDELAHLPVHNPEPASVVIDVCTPSIASTVRAPACVVAFTIGVTSSGMDGAASDCMSPCSVVSAPARSVS